MKNSDDKLRKKILNENIREHQIEGKYYDIIHREIFNKYEQDRIKKNLSHIFKKIGKKNIKVLDVGSGTGNLVTNLLTFNKKFDFEITAVDLSKEMQDVMKKKLKSKNIKYHLNDVDSFLKENKKNYDLIMISSVLHHLPNYQETTQNLLKILNNNGIIFITHEPLNNSLKSNSRLYHFIEFLDFKLYQLNYIKNLALKKVKRLVRDCTHSDFHVGVKGIYPKKFTSYLNENNPNLKNKIIYYSQGYFLANLKNKLKFKDHFEIIIEKNEKN